jgi:PAS domain S-box-containing protein
MAYTDSAADISASPAAVPPTAMPPSLPAALLAVAVDTVDACVAILSGPELRFTFANRACEALRPDTPMLGRPLTEVFPATAGGELEAQLLRVLRTGERWKLDRFESASAAGELRVWDGEVVAAAAPGAPDASIVVFARNITATVQVERALAASEEALRRSNHKLRETIDSITDGLVVMDRDWRFTMVSDRAAAIVGLGQHEMIGGRVWDIFPYAAGTKFHDCYHDAVASGQPVQFEEYYPAPLDLWLECNCYPSADGLTVYFRDVSERRHAEQALNESTALLSAISDSSPDVIYAKDDQGRLRFANPATVALIGKPLEQILGRTDAELLGDSEAARQVMENDRRIMDSGAGEELEELVPMPDGEERIWLSMKLALTDKAGRVVGLLGISRDITDRKRAEQRLRDENHRKDEFLAMLAHELRNPLAPIATGAHLLEISAHDEGKVRHAARIISRQAAHMTELVDDLLDVSRVTRGLIVLDKADIDLRLVLSHAIEQARPLIDARRHSFDATLCPDTVFVHGDRTRLIQTVSNLLNNAAKYTPPGGRIALAVSAGADAVEISVTDTGIGIAPALLPKVFDLFSQGERTPDRSQGGLGLGLALVKSIVAMHGGDVAVRSAGAGQGSTFLITLPRLAQGDAQPDAPVALGRGRDTTRSVMVVDDNIDAGNTLAELLEAHGHRVLVKSDAHAALEAAANETPDVFILDIGLPDMNGYELASRLRAHPASKGATLVALTGYGQSKDRDAGKQAGFDHYFVKPVNAEELAQVLAR